MKDEKKLEYLATRISKLFDKMASQDSFVDIKEEEEDIFLAEIDNEMEDEICVMMGDADWIIDQAVTTLDYKGIPYQIIVNNLLKQAVEIAHLNFNEDDSWKDFVNKLFDFHTVRVATL